MDNLKYLIFLGFWMNCFPAVVARYCIIWSSALLLLYFPLNIDSSVGLCGRHWPSASRLNNWIACLRTLPRNSWQNQGNHMCEEWIINVCQSTANKSLTFVQNLCLIFFYRNNKCYAGQSIFGKVLMDFLASWGRKSGEAKVEHEYKWRCCQLSLLRSDLCSRRQCRPPSCGSESFGRKVRLFCRPQREDQVSSETWTERMMHLVGE